MDLAAGPAATVSRYDGRGYTFSLLNGVWATDPGIRATLIRLTDVGGAPVGWQYIDVTDEIETYDVNGRLVAISNRAGFSHLLTYNAQGQLATVTDTVGRSLLFSYDSAGRITGMNDPAASAPGYQYIYDAGFNLKSVTYPDGTVKVYHYEAPSGATWLLTGVTDENNSRYSTYSYNTEGQALSSELAGVFNESAFSTAAVMPS